MKEFKDPISPVLAQILSKKEERTCFNCDTKYEFTNPMREPECPCCGLTLAQAIYRTSC